MNTKRIRETGWMITLHGVFLGKHYQQRNQAILEHEKRMVTVWDYDKQLGYRCVRVTITEQKPKGRKK